LDYKIAIQKSRISRGSRKMVCLGWCRCCDSAQ